MTLAPIGISVYTRINHFKQCIESLQKNALAQESKLFIYSDASSKTEDDNLVEEVRKYSYEIKGFKTVHVIEREKNYGGTQNASQAHREITQEFDRSIFMEDDIICAPGFLTYMNEALEFYKDDTSINSITGFSPLFQSKNINDDVFICPVFSGWGVGMWKRSFDCYNQINEIDVKNMKYSEYFMDTFRYNFLPQQLFGEIDAGDVQMTFYQTIKGKFTIYPTQSLVRNIGYDGSGVHCGIDDKNSKIVLSEKIDFTFNEEVTLDNEIFNSFKESRKVSLKTKIKSILKYPIYHFYFLIGLYNDNKK